MNNHQNAIFHQITNFLKTPLALLGVDLKNFQFNKICHFANHPYLCKGLLLLNNKKSQLKNRHDNNLLTGFNTLLIHLTTFELIKKNAYSVLKKNETK